jgi:hypothetical protein
VHKICLGLNSGSWQYVKKAFDSFLPWQVKKTRRGKRAGRNLKDRASFEGRRTSVDSRRGSVDGRASLDMQYGLRDGRASVDSQRPSLDLPQVCATSFHSPANHR